MVASALDRERAITTALGDGIAMPHAKTDAVSEPVVVYARSRAGIDWSSRDGKPATELPDGGIYGAAGRGETAIVLQRDGARKLNPASWTRLSVPTASMSPLLSPPASRSRRRRGSMRKVARMRPLVKG